MITTVGIIDMINKVNNWTDYRTAIEFGVSQTNISTWRNRGSVMNDKTGRKAAQILGLEEDFILYCLYTERLAGSPVFDTLLEKEEELIAANGGLESARRCILC